MYPKFWYENMPSGNPANKLRTSLQLIFHFIVKHNQDVAGKGLLSQDTIKRRQRRNVVNMQGSIL
jgi:hypothetical protein